MSLSLVHFTSSVQLCLTVCIWACLTVCIWACPAIDNNRKRHIFIPLHSYFCLHKYNSLCVFTSKKVSTSQSSQSTQTILILCILILQYDKVQCCLFGCNGIKRRIRSKNIFYHLHFCIHDYTSFSSSELIGFIFILYLYIKII